MYRSLMELRPSHGLTGSYSRLAGLLLDYASRILVLAQSDKLRMSQPIGLRPFQEFDLCDGFRPQPNCFLHLLRVQLFSKSRSSRLRQIHEWAVRRRKMFQFREDLSPGSRDKPV